MPVQKFFQVPPGHIFHGHEILFTNLTQMICLNNICMNQVCNKLSLPDEIITKFIDCGVLFSNQFDSHYFTKSTNSPLNCFVNHTHTTLSNLSGQLVVNFVKNVFHTDLQHE